MNILIMCPHNAAKSVLAESFALKMQAELGLVGLNFRTAGTDPSAETAKQVIAYLKEREMALPIGGPQRVEQKDIDEADLLVSFGCELGEFDVGKVELVEWLGVADTDVDLGGAATEIERRVTRLIADLKGIR